MDISCFVDPQLDEISSPLDDQSVEPFVPGPCQVCPSSNSESAAPIPAVPDLLVEPPPDSPPDQPVATPPVLLLAPTRSMTTRSKVGIFKPRYIADMVFTSLIQALVVSNGPRGFKYAAKHPHWMAAMDEEMRALANNNTWELVPRPPGVNIVGSK